MKLPKPKQRKVAASTKQLKIQYARSLQLSPSEATWDIVKQANILPPFETDFLCKIERVRIATDIPAPTEVPVLDITTKAVLDTASPTSVGYSRTVCLNLLARAVQYLNDKDCNENYRIVVEPIVYESLSGDHRKDKKPD